MVHAQDTAQVYFNIADPAPSLYVQEWLKGTPIQQFEKGRIYVIEFWATWCKPISTLYLAIINSLFL